MKEWIIFVFVTIVIIFGSMSVFNAGIGMDWQVTGEGDQVNESFTVNGVWDGEEALNNTCEVSPDQSINYPETRSSCKWISKPQQNLDEDNLILETTADAGDGSVNATVKGYEYPPEDQAGPNESVEVPISTGEKTNYIGLKDLNYYYLEFDLEETDGSKNQRPHLHNFNLIFSADQTVGINSSTLQTLTLMVYLIGIMLFFSRAVA